VIFERRELITQIADRVLTKKNKGRKFDSYYWRAPFGSGKSVFLKLIGRELQKRDCDVYLIPSAESLNAIRPETFFPQLAREAGDKTVVLLIDEVQSNVNSAHWIPLLKVPPANLLVLGVGLVRVEGYSPQFGTKYPKEDEMFAVFLNESDLPEVKAQFKKLYPDLPQSIRDDTCEKILEYTAGQIFPFVAIVDHLLQKIQKENVDLDRYLSSKEFLDSEVFAGVKDRCFGSLRGDILGKVAKYLLGKDEVGDDVDLQKVGVIRHSEGLFTSPLMTHYIFRHMSLPPVDVVKMALDDSGKTPYAEQIICAGLRNMKEEDFQDPNFHPRPPVENAIGFRWGQYVRGSYPNLFFTSHSRTMVDDHPAGPGAKPTFDFVFNGKLNLGIEILLNGNSKAVEEHLSRFDGRDKSYKNNGVIFHIDTVKNEPTIHLAEPYESDDAKNRIYTFLKKQNVLYRGSILVNKGVCKNLPTPTTRPFSTFAFGHLRRVVKFF
jgi:hypothetical protein